MQNVHRILIIKDFFLYAGSNYWGLSALNSLEPEIPLFCSWSVWQRLLAVFLNAISFPP